MEHVSMLSTLLFVIGHLKPVTLPSFSILLALIDHGLYMYLHMTKASDQLQTDMINHQTSYVFPIKAPHQFCKFGC